MASRSSEVRPSKPFLKIDRGRLVAAGARLEVGLFLEAEEARVQGARELSSVGVVSLHRLVEATPLGGDPVLGSLELQLQVAEGLGGAQLRVALHDDQQTRQRRGEAVLCLLEGSQLLRVGHPVDLHLPHLGARLDHRGERLLLEVGGSLDRRHQVGDQIGAALVDVLHLTPGTVGRLLQLDEAVVGSAAAERHGGSQQ
jgi:hypothetical protein